MDIQWNNIIKFKPQQNVLVERFYRTYREDILDAHLFYSLSQIDEVTKPWKVDYNAESQKVAVVFANKTRK